MFLFFCFIVDSGYFILREYNDFDIEFEVYYDDDFYWYWMFIFKFLVNRLVEEIDVSIIWLKWKEYFVKKKFVY